MLEDADNSSSDLKSNKRQRLGRVKSAEKAYEVVKGSEYAGSCGEHTYGDLRTLEMDLDETYCYRKQKRAANRQNIARHCFGCGKIF